MFKNRNGLPADAVSARASSIVVLAHVLLALPVEIPHLLPVEVRPDDVRLSYE